MKYRPSRDADARDQWTLRVAIQWNFLLQVTSSLHYVNRSQLQIWHFRVSLLRVWCTERKCGTFSSPLQHLSEAPWWYDIGLSTSTGLHDKIKQIHTNFLQATSITTWGSTQQESERDDKRYPLPVSVQLQTCIITYHSWLLLRSYSRTRLILPPMSLYLFSSSDCVRASTSAVFYWEDIIPVLLSTDAFAAKIPGALKAKEDYQQQQGSTYLGQFSSVCALWTRLDDNLPHGTENRKISKNNRK